MFVHDPDAQSSAVDPEPASFGFGFTFGAIDSLMVSIRPGRPGDVGPNLGRDLGVPQTEMRFYDRSLSTPAANLAMDEALLHWCAARPGEEVLRVWTPASWFVVLGQSNRHLLEVRADVCAAEGVPILRRCSGGGTVLQGPGCLNFALVLEVAARPGIETVGRANQTIMEVHRGVLAELLGRPVRVEGVTDLTVDGRKFSGNAQRRTRGCVLFHGTFLLQLDVDRLERLLPLPPRPPEYRRGRSHRDFVARLELPAATVVAALRQAWNAQEAFAGNLEPAVAQLVRERYGRAEWTFKF